MKKTFSYAILLFAVSAFLTSCYSTRITYGDVKPNEPIVQVNQKWNSHFVAGLITGSDAKQKSEEFVAGAPNFVVKTNFSFWNGLVSGVTFGIYTPNQTKYYIPLRDMKGGQNIKTDTNN